MRNDHLGPLALVLVVWAAAATGCRPATYTGGSSSTDPNQVDVGTLTIEVTGDGPPRSATITCGQPNRGTGYLGGKLEHASSACVTALISWPAIHFLDDGKLPSKKECRPRGTAPAGAVATLKGPWDGPYINRRIQTGRSRCEDALWTFLLPVLSPQEDEVVLFEAQLKAGNNGLPLATSTSTTTTTTTTSTSTP